MTREELIETMARACDREQAAQMGESSPWQFPDSVAEAESKSCIQSALSAAEAVGWVIAPLDLLTKAYAVMRECGWQLAIGAEPQGDGILEAACTEIEADFAEFLATGAGEPK